MNRLLGLLALALTATIAGADAHSAEGAFPGRNGLIVFASDRSPLFFGEIFSLDTRTGRVERVTSNWRTELEPVRAPRGERIAFVGDDGIYVARPDGSRARRVAALARPWDAEALLEWSPRGDRLAFAHRGSVYVVGVSGGRPATVIGRGDALVAWLVWTPDGRSLAAREAFGMMRMADLSTRRVRTLRLPGHDDFGRPAWSPDGRWVAYPGEGATVMLARAAGAPARRLARGVLGELSWSPDSRRLAVGEALVDVASGAVRRVASTHEYARPLWSPDGRRVAIVAKPAERVATIRIASAAGTTERLVRLGGYGIPRASWSPDGRRLVYGWSEDEDRGTDLYVIRPDGSGLRRLTGAGAGYWSPTWSPDGRRIAARCGESICLLDPAGSVKGTLRLQAEAFDPAWSPDGRQLAFSSFHRNGETAIEVVGIDGTNRRRLVTAADRFIVANPTWAPDGTRIAYTLIERIGRDAGSGTPCCTATLMVLDLASGTSRPLKVNRGVAYDPRPSWSPDSTRLVLVDAEGADPGCALAQSSRDDRCPTSGLFTVGAEGGPVQPVRAFTGAVDPAWSPDGSRIVFTAGDALAVAAASGGTPRFLAGRRGRPGYDSSPDWQPLP